MPKNTTRELLSLPLIAIINLFSYLPLWFLYIISWWLGFLLHRVFRYRLQHVRKNLKRSFPEKTIQQRRAIESRFYRQFSDVIVEVLKLKTMSFAQLKKRCVYSEASVALMNRYYDQGKSVLIVLGHVGNWEWAGSAYPLYHKHQIITAYRPLRNKVFDKDTLKMRQRTGNILATMKNLAREMLRNRSRIVATALIADQTPPPDNAFWVDFLNQPTPFYKGTEVLSQKFNTPLIWGSVKRVKRGYYRIELELITDEPTAFKKPGELTRLHVSFLERDIRNQPEAWLWSHRRWKHVVPKGIELIR
ncbi:MAG: lysophospholipid acyltransferase family protein [Bacteroidota bacterium]